MSILSQLDRLAVRAEAPCRIDLAGGTLDIAPLCWFEGPVTVLNAAIDVFARADLRARGDGRFVIRSEDLGREVRYDDLKELVESEAESALGLIVEAVRFWQPPVGLTLTTSCAAPKGSGLGGSSALLVAVLGALKGMYGGRFGRAEIPDNKKFVERAAAIEARHIGIPTGTQDYAAALLGGPLGIRYDADGPNAVRLTLSGSMRRMLDDDLLVLYSGIEHSSSRANWSVVRGYIDKDPAVRTRIRKLKKIADDVAIALGKSERETVCGLLNQEWALRKELTPEVGTPELTAIVEAVREAGAEAAKVCGAGGGGSLIAIAPKEKHAAIVAAVEAKGGRRLAVRLSDSGLRMARLGPEGEELPPAAVTPTGAVVAGDGGLLEDSVDTEADTEVFRAATDDGDDDNG